MAKKLRLFGRKILVRKCITGTNDGTGHKIGAIYLIDQRVDHQQWCEILDVSADCKYFKPGHVGAFVYLPEWKPNDIARVVEEDFVVKERLFERNEAPLMVVEA